MLTGERSTVAAATRQEASLRFQLDDEDRFSLELGFTRGRESLDDDPVDRWVAGLGFKF